MFTYAHVKWFYGQSERAYYLNYFIIHFIIIVIIVIIVIVIIIIIIIIITGINHSSILVLLGFF